MGDRLNIGIIAHSYIPVSGGIQTYIHSKAVEFVKKGHNVHVVIPNNSMREAPHTIIEGVHVHRASVENIDWSYPVEDNRIEGWTTYNDHRRWGAQVVQMAMEALPIFQAERVDLVHTHFTATFVGELLWLFHRIPYVDSIYGFYSDYQPSPDMQQAAQHFYHSGGMRAVIVVGNYVRRLCEAGGIPGDLLHTVNPSVDFARFDPMLIGPDIVAKYRMPIGQETRVIFCPIRLQERKGFTTALQTLAQIKAHYPDCHLIISGGSSANPAGIEKPLATYHQMTRDLDIAEQCSLLLNKISDDDMPSFYQRADVVLMPSLQEGFGISVLEALAMRRPIVATNIPPFRESSSDYALFFEPNDAIGSTKAVLKTLEGDALIVRQVQQGFAHVRYKYAASRLADEMLDIYHRVLERPFDRLDRVAESVVRTTINAGIDF